MTNDAEDTDKAIVNNNFLNTLMSECYICFFVLNDEEERFGKQRLENPLFIFIDPLTSP